MSDSENGDLSEASEDDLFAGIANELSGFSGETDSDAEGETELEPESSDDETEGEEDDEVADDSEGESNEEPEGSSSGWNKELQKMQQKMSSQEDKFQKNLDDRDAKMEKFLEESAKREEMLIKALGGQNQETEAKPKSQREKLLETLAAKEDDEPIDAKTLRELLAGGGDSEGVSALKVQIDELKKQLETVGDLKTEFESEKKQTSDQRIWAEQREKHGFDTKPVFEEALKEIRAKYPNASNDQLKFAATDRYEQKLEAKKAGSGTDGKAKKTGKKVKKTTKPAGTSTGNSSVNNPVPGSDSKGYANISDGLDLAGDLM